MGHLTSQEHFWEQQFKEVKHKTTAGAKHCCGASLLWMLEINFGVVKGNVIIFNLLLLHRAPGGPAAFNVRGPNRPIKTNTHVLPATIILLCQSHR